MMKMVSASGVNFDNYANVKSIVLDIEGTTSSVSFVKETLFPYVRNNLKKYLESNWEGEELKGDIKLLQEQAAKDKTDEIEGFVPIEDGDKLKETLLNNIFWQMDIDRKTTALKQIQGHIWREGYAGGHLKGHVYDDVAASLREWVDGGRRLYVYSSGSVDAQKLLFGHSEAGSLVDVFTGYFDTQIGPKTATESYTAIAKEIGDDASDILFLTDVVKEAESARGAGLHAILVIREGNVPLTEEAKQQFLTVNSLADLTFERCAKRAKKEAPPAEVAKPVEEIKADTPMDTTESKPENGSEAEPIEEVKGEKEVPKAETTEEMDAEAVPQVEKSVEEKIETVSEPVPETEKKITIEETGLEAQTESDTSAKTVSETAPASETEMVIVSSTTTETNPVSDTAATCEPKPDSDSTETKPLSDEPAVVKETVLETKPVEDVSPIENDTDNSKSKTSTDKLEEEVSGMVESKKEELVVEKKNEEPIVEEVKADPIKKSVETDKKITEETEENDTKTDEVIDEVEAAPTNGLNGTNGENHNEKSKAAATDSEPISVKKMDESNDTPASVEVAAE